MPRAQRPHMDGYGVPADPAGVLPWSWAEQRLMANRNYWVVTASATGRPHAMPVWGVWLASPDRFWFSCAPGARKVRNLRANPQCVIAVADTVECVSVEGSASVITNDVEPSRIDAVVAAYLVKYWPESDSTTDMEAFLRANALVEVVPDRAFGIIEREAEFAERATRWVW